ncbi:MAG: signal peptidase I [Gemmatimonadota bacterium]
MDRRERMRRRRDQRPQAGGRASELAGPSGEGPRGGRARGGELWEWTKTILLTLGLLVVIRTFLVQTFVITSGSMEDTLLVGDFLMVNRVALGTRIPGTLTLTPGYSEPERGDVLVFDPAHEEGMKLVKRLVGMPGDTLEMRQKRLYLNGAIQEEPYVKWSDPTGDDQDPRMLWQRDHLAPGVDPAAYRPTRDTWGPLVVPMGHYFMLGDNRDFSLDSRYWGVIERWRLEGRAMFFYFSYNRDSTEAFPFFREIRWDRIGNRIE